jgi:Dehydratase family
MGIIWAPCAWRDPSSDGQVPCFGAENVARLGSGPLVLPRDALRWRTSSSAQPEWTRFQAGPQRATAIQETGAVLTCLKNTLERRAQLSTRITSALKYLDFGKHIAVLTDARFSGVSTGACIGHISPEALAGGPIGKVLDGDVIEILVDRVNLEGSVNLVGHGADLFGAAEGTRVLAARAPRTDLAPDPDLPPETRLWAALQQVSGGTWGGCVYDPDAILTALGR